MIIGSVGWIAIRSEDFPAAYLEPAPESLQLGHIWPRSDLTVPLTIRNRGSRSLVVRDFETSHGFIVAHPLPHAIPAGDAANFHLRADLSKVLASTRDLETEPWDEPFELVVRPVTNWGRASLLWRIRGVARMPVRGLPPNVSFGLTLIEGVTADPREFELEVHEAIEKLEITSSTPLIQAELIQGDESEEVYELPVRLIRALIGGPD
jgi:hypothetical protein